MRKTKIVCTMGPGSDSRETLIKMIQAGMNVARFNFSHGDYAEQLQRINMVKQLRDELDIPIALLLDTKGPEIRIRTFAEGKAFLQTGNDFDLTINEIVGNDKIVGVSFKKFTKVIKPGMDILISDGLIHLVAKEVTADTVKCVIKVGGVLTNRKSINVPNVDIDMNYLSDVDRADILFGIQNGIDLIALSFVRSADDVKIIRQLLLENGGADVDIIAKIENRKGVKNIAEIIDAADGIMVARGDLGVEVPYEELPKIQKNIIFDCYRAGKKVITATQMLESMMNASRPTRAEVSDVANAAYDGTSATMLSGETASGKYPVEAVATMAKVLMECEKDIDFRTRYSRHEVNHTTITGAISDATVSAAYDLNAKGIIVFTTSGKTARQVSSFRPTVPIFAYTTDRKTFYKMSINWGVVPLMAHSHKDVEKLIKFAMDDLKKKGYVEKGDIVCITAGVPLEQTGPTNLLKIMEID